MVVYRNRDIAGKMIINRDVEKVMAGVEGERRRKGEI